jgi:hypothetical protein
VNTSYDITLGEFFYRLAPRLASQTYLSPWRKMNFTAV